MRRHEENQSPSPTLHFILSAHLHPIQSTRDEIKWAHDTDASNPGVDAFVVCSKAFQVFLRGLCKEKMLPPAYIEPRPGDKSSKLHLSLFNNFNTQLGAVASPWKPLTLFESSFVESPFVTQGAQILHIHLVK
jgi:hypothetical protein